LLNDVAHHIVIVLSQSALNIKFNQNQLDTEYGASNLYNNIAFYEKAFTSAEAINNYRLYCSDNSKVVTDPGVTISESAQGQDGTSYFIRLFDQ
jgi:hypothetical protein